MLLFQDILKSMDGTAYTPGPGHRRLPLQARAVERPPDRGVRLPGLALGARPWRVTPPTAFRSLAEALPLGRISEMPGKAMRRIDLLRGLR
jgi:hypothetical protein